MKEKAQIAMIKLAMTIEGKARVGRAGFSGLRAWKQRVRQVPSSEKSDQTFRMRTGGDTRLWWVSALLGDAKGSHCKGKKVFLFSFFGVSL